jgi:hypothetical protein
MQRSFWAAAAVAVALAAPAYASGDHEGKIPWIKEPAEGFQQAKLSGKPILLYFTASW